MKKRIFLRVMALALVCLTLLVPLTACKKDAGDDAGTANAVSTDGQGGEKDSLDGVYFDGETIEVLSWNPSNLEEYVEVNDSRLDAIDQSIYERNVMALERLNLKINWKEIEGNAAAATEYVETATNANLGGAGYDMYVCYSGCAASLMINGVLRDLNKYDTLDFSKPWWPQSIVNDCTVNGKLYFCTGDISTNLVFMTSAVFFNKELVAQYSINEKVQALYEEEDLYALVKSGKWTYEAMMELCEGVYADADGDTKKSDGDIYGLGTYGTLVDNFYYGAGYKTMVAKDGGFALSEDFSRTDAITDILDNVGYFLHDSGYARFYSGTTPHEKVRDSFSANLNVFSLAPASHAYMKHFSSGVSYGVMPVPKYDAGQDKYYSVHSIPYSMFAIAGSASKGEQAAAYIQALGAAAYDTSRVTIIENTLQLRYADDLSDSEMWNIVLDSQTFDLGRVFATQLKSGDMEQATIYLFRDHLSNGTFTWSSTLRTHKDSLEAKIAELTANIANLEG